MIGLTQLSLPIRAQKILVGCLAISLISGYISIHKPGNPFLTQIKEAYGNLKTSASIHEQKQIAQKLMDIRPGTILCNDDVNFGIIYFTQKPSMFLMPHEFEFPSAISNPQVFTPYFLWTKNTNIDFLSQWFQYKMPENYRVVAEFEHYTLYGLEGY